MVHIERKSKLFTIIIYLLYILAGLAMGSAIVQIMNLGFKSLTFYFYSLVCTSILLYLLGMYLRSLKLKWLKLHIEIIEFILAFRDFEETHLCGFVKGSSEWLGALSPFQETCRNHGATWEHLLQSEIDDYMEISASRY